MTITVALSQSAILTALRAFLIEIVPTGCQVILAQQNRTPEPLGDFVVMTPISRARLSTNVDAFIQPVSPAVVGGYQAMQPTQFGIQIDVHGPASAENAQIIATLFRDNWGVDQFYTLAGNSIAPLYCEDPRQMPFLNAEQQYEWRWVLTCYLQANELVSGIPQESATELEPTLFPIEATYPIP